MFFFCSRKVEYTEENTNGKLATKHLISRYEYDDEYDDSYDEFAKMEVGKEGEAFEEGIFFVLVLVKPKKTRSLRVEKGSLLHKFFYISDENEDNKIEKNPNRIEGGEEEDEEEEEGEGVDNNNNSNSNNNAGHGRGRGSKHAGYPENMVIFFELPFIEAHW